MSISPSLAAQGVRFKVLAQVFPVLRHEVVGPLSNATLATAMLRQTPDGADADALQQRCHRLAGDLTGMLEDSVTIVRELDQWLLDSNATLSAEALLRECRKLMFSHLLLSRHSVIWPEDVADIQVPQFTSRYLLLAWLLSLLSVLPADATLTLDCSQPDAWHAHFPEDLASAAPTASPAFAPEEVELLATVSGWRLERQAQCWSLRLPAATPAQ
ncbi:hypothetical protein LP085_14750 [Achromobacter sp. MY14]|uniref:hypothetical protein n=1 Tax=unclassified Achromobacter TaxID=2626865 RepID=UPI001E601642|nr:hypothetical protein [Achromobacter sp. MY14]MCD0498114.1 hypothetical protein [Achromobacter sp. MY14]